MLRRAQLGVWEAEAPVYGNNFNCKFEAGEGRRCTLAGAERCVAVGGQKPECRPSLTRLGRFSLSCDNIAALIMIEHVWRNGADGVENETHLDVMTSKPSGGIRLHYYGGAAAKKADGMANNLARPLHVKSIQA